MTSILPTGSSVNAYYLRNMQKSAETAAATSPFALLQPQGSVFAGQDVASAASAPPVSSSPVSSQTAVDAQLVAQGQSATGTDAQKPVQKQGGSSVVDQFLAYVHETPAQKMEDAILKSMGLTKEDLDNMDPQQRAAVEEKIKEKLKEQMKEAATGSDGGPDTSLLV